MTSEEKLIELSFKVLLSIGDKNKVVSLSELIYETLVLDDLDFENPLIAAIEAGLSQGFLAAYGLEDFPLSLKLAELADKAANRIPDYQMGCSRTANNRALALSELGRFVEADRFYQLAFSLVKHEKDILNLAGTIQSNMASMNDMRGLDPISELCEIRKPLFNIDQPHIGISKAMALAESGELDKAKVIYHELLNGDTKLEIKIHATVLSNLSLVEEALGNKTKSELHLVEAEDLCRSMGYTGQALSGILYQLGELHLNSRREDSVKVAATYLKEAWDIVRKVSPVSKLALIVLHGLGKVRMIQKDYVRARSIFERAISLYDQMRSSSGCNEVELQGLFSIYRTIIELRCWVALHESTAFDVFTLIQKAKSRYWLESLSSAQMLEKNDQAFKSESDLNALVGFNGTLIEFFVGPNVTFIVIIHNCYVGAHRINITETQLKSDVDAIYENLSMGFDSAREISELSEKLFGAISFPGNNHRLVILALDGPLWKIPTSLLVSPKLKCTLGDFSPAIVIPSANVLKQARISSTNTEGKQTLIIAHEGSHSFSALADCAEEINFVNSTLKRDGSTIILANHERAAAAATPLEVIAHLPAASHVHITAHAIGGSKDTEAQIILSNGKGGDASLTMSQIQGLSLNADLVVLATCESSLGRSSPGEGLASLARAFLLAGAKITVASLWELRDQNAKEFFRLFYSLINEVESIAMAFSKAKRLYEEKYGRDEVSTGLIIFGDADCYKDRTNLNYITDHLENRIPV